MRPNPYPGKFIVFEGIEGSGKTTQTPRLVQTLQNKGCPVLQTKEPTEDSIFGRLVRFIYKCESLYADLPKELERYLGDKEYQLIKAMAAEAQKRRLGDLEKIMEEVKDGNRTNLPMLIQLGMIFDRLEHRIKLEIPALGRGTYVVSDRDFLSTLAYGAGDGISWKKLLHLHEDILDENFIVPDLVILLTVPPEIGLARTMEKQKGKKDYFDTKIQKIHNAYLKIVENSTIRANVQIAKIDGAAEPEDVTQKVWEVVSTFCG